VNFAAHEMRNPHGKGNSSRSRRAMRGAPRASLCTGLTVTTRHWSQRNGYPVIKQWAPDV
jgi:hypothetical protein